MSILDQLAALWGRKPAEQVGASTAPGAVDPLAHLGQQAPEAMAGIEWTGADYDQVATRPAPPTAGRTWRMPITGAPATNADVALSDAAHTAADQHLGHGEPDTRRAEADRSAGPRTEFQALPEYPRNVREDVRLDPEAAPARTRQGFTGEDPTRAARQQVAFTIRPFDQGIAHHPGAVTKAGQPNPLAARPPERKRLVGGRPSPAGSTGTGMEPVGGQPNTVRTVPTPWDSRVVNAGAETPTSTGRLGGWRAR